MYDILKIEVTLPEFGIPFDVGGVVLNSTIPKVCFYMAFRTAKKLNIPIHINTNKVIIKPIENENWNRWILRLSFVIANEHYTIGQFDTEMGLSQIHYNKKLLFSSYDTFITGGIRAI